MVFEISQCTKVVVAQSGMQCIIMTMTTCTKEKSFDQCSHTAHLSCLLSSVGDDVLPPGRNLLGFSALNLCSHSHVFINHNNNNMLARSMTSGIPALHSSMPSYELAFNSTASLLHAKLSVRGRLGEDAHQNGSPTQSPGPLPLNATSFSCARLACSDF